MKQSTVQQRVARLVWQQQSTQRADKTLIGWRNLPLTRTSKTKQNYKEPYMWYPCTHPFSVHTCFSFLVLWAQALCVCYRRYKFTYRFASLQTLPFLTQLAKCNDEMPIFQTEFVDWASPTKNSLPLLYKALCKLGMKSEIQVFIMPTTTVNISKMST